MSKNEIQMMTYNDWKKINDDIKHQKRMRYIKANKKMALYYQRQRIMGYLITLLGMVALIIGCFNRLTLLNAVSIVVLGIGLYCVFTKRMIYIDTYYFECQDRLRNVI